jgi:hypothetical protein
MASRSVREPLGLMVLAAMGFVVAFLLAAGGAGDWTGRLAALCIVAFVVGGVMTGVRLLAGPQAVRPPRQRWTTRHPHLTALAAVLGAVAVFAFLAG